MSRRRGGRRAPAVPAEWAAAAALAARSRRAMSSMLVTSTCRQAERLPFKYPSFGSQTEKVCLPVIHASATLAEQGRGRRLGTVFLLGIGTPFRFFNTRARKSTVCRSLPCAQEHRRERMLCGCDFKYTRAHSRATARGPPGTRAPSLQRAKPPYAPSCRHALPLASPPVCDSD